MDADLALYHCEPLYEDALANFEISHLWISDIEFDLFDSGEFTHLAISLHSNVMTGFVIAIDMEYWLVAKLFLVITIPVNLANY